MAMPDNVRSTNPVTGKYLYPDRKPKLDPLEDYELGGIALYDPSAGLDYQEWIGTYEEPYLVLTPQRTGSPVNITLDYGITEFSFSFDQNMHETITYIKGDRCYLNWYDTAAASQVTTDFGTNKISPRLSLDDKRYALFTWSDVLFFYLNPATTGIYYRQQRDRYATERLIGYVSGTYRSITGCGMNVHGRIQVQLD